MVKEVKTPKYTKNKDKLNSSLSKDTKNKAKNRVNKIVEQVENTEKFLGLSLIAIGLLIVIVGFSIFLSSRVDNIATPDYVLKINNNSISIEDIENDLLSNPNINNNENILSNYLNDTILLEEARVKGYSTTSEEVENYISALAVQSGSSIDDLKAALIEVNTTYDNFKQYIEKAIIISKLIENEIKPNIEVTKEDAKNFYELNIDIFEQPKQFNVSHILVKDKTRAQAILEEAKNTQDFDTLVEKYKNDSLEATNFIYYQGSVVEPFQDAVDSVDTGLYDGLVESNYTTFSGYHIVYVYEKIDATKTDYDDVEENIITFLENEKSNEELTSYIDNLVKNTSIWLNYQKLDSLDLDYENLETIYKLSNKNICLNENSKIAYFSDKQEYDKSIAFYDITNPAIIQIFTECFGNDVNISNVNLPVMVCLKNDVIIEGGNLKQIETICN